MTRGTSHELTCRLAIRSLTEVLARQGQKRRLADSAGDHQQVLARLRCKTIAQRTPYLQFLSRQCPRQQSRQFADHQVDQIDGDRRAARGMGEHRVIQRQRPAQQRIVDAGQPHHQELSGHDPSRQARAIETNAVGVSANSHIVDDGDELRPA